MNKTKIEWIEDLAEAAILNKTPIFMKDNLQNIWKDKLIQEFPE